MSTADNPENKYVDWLTSEGLLNVHRDDVINIAMVDALNTQKALKFAPAQITDVIAVNWMAKNMEKLATARYPKLAMAILNDEIKYVNKDIEETDKNQRPSVDQMTQMYGILKQAEAAALSQTGGFRRRTKYTNKHHKKSRRSRKTKSRRH